VKQHLVQVRDVSDPEAAALGAAVERTVLARDLGQLDAAPRAIHDSSVLLETVGRFD
jgi:hypothetical protein